MPYRDFDKDRPSGFDASYVELRDKSSRLGVGPTAQDPVLRQATETYRKQQLRSLARLPVMDQERLRSIMAPARAAVDRNLRNLVASLQPKLVLQKLRPRVPLVPKLPNLADMVDMRGMLRKAAEAAQRAVEATAEGDATLEASGFGFADHLWNWGFVASFAHIDPKVRDAVVTNRLAAVTRSEKFEEWLRQEISGSKALKRRWPVVQQALGAHRRKEYLISVPPLLTQVEGLVGDALIMKSMAARDGHKLYRLGADGEVELNKKGKPIELAGLTQLMGHADFADHEALEDAVSFFTDSLIPWRHAILHGRNVGYGTAKLSVQALLILLLFATEARAFEEGRPPSAPAPYKLLPRPARAKG